MLYYYYNQQYTPIPEIIYQVSMTLACLIPWYLFGPLLLPILALASLQLAPATASFTLALTINDTTDSFSNTNTDSTPIKQT